VEDEEANGFRIDAMRAGVRYFIFLDQKNSFHNSWLAEPLRSEGVIETSSAPPFQRIVGFPLEEQELKLLFFAALVSASYLARHLRLTLLDFFRALRL
jgi:hypothetical protein